MTVKFPFSKGIKPEYFLVLDIGTEAVKALICSEFQNPLKEKDRKIIIHEARIQYFDEFGVFDTTDFEKEALKKTISEAIKEIQRLDKVKTEKLLLGLPANILRGRVVFEIFKRENPEKIINQVEKVKIQKAVLNKARTELSNQFAQKLNLLSEDFYFSSLKILKRKIDGYEVPAIQELKGKILEFEILAIFLPKYYLKKIEEILKSLNLKISKIVHPAENLSFLFSHEVSDAILLDIGGKLTKIFLLEKGDLKEVSEFESGGSYFTKKLSEFLGMNFQEARALKHKLSRSSLSKPTENRIRGILSGQIQDWFKSLKKTLRSFSKKLLPSNIFLFGGGSLLPEIQEILRKGDWKGFSFIARPKIKQVYPKDFKDVELKSKGLNSPQQVSPLLISYG